MIYDCFPFFDEYDLLECRLRELEDIPVKHVLAEAPVTHTGTPKPFYYAENKERFAPWADRIIHVMLTEFDMNRQISAIEDQDPWTARHRLAMAQRRCLTLGLAGADPEDLILLSDVDEIPRGGIVSESMPVNRTLEMSLHNFAVDWLHPLPWNGMVTARARTIADLEALRSARNKFPRIRHAGWHFSWLGGPEVIKQKALITSHTETAAQMAEWADKGFLYQRGLTWEDGKPFGLTAQMKPTSLDDLPQWVREHKCPETWFRPEIKLTWRR